MNCAGFWIFETQEANAQAKFIRRVQLREMPDQYRNGFGPLPQRRNVDWKYLHSVVQILAKRRMLDHGSQVAMRGGDQAYINFVSAVAAEPLKFLLLQNAQ